MKFHYRFAPTLIFATLPQPPGSGTLYSRPRCGCRVSSDTQIANIGNCVFLPQCDRAPRVASVEAQAYVGHFVISLAVCWSCSTQSSYPAIRSSGMLARTQRSRISCSASLQGRRVLTRSTLLFSVSAIACGAALHTQPIQSNDCNDRRED
jgi:hypothetical protein